MSARKASHPIGRPPRAAASALVGLAALALAAPGTAPADVGDIRQLALDEQLLGSAEAVEVTGKIGCAAILDYGLSVKVTQPAGPQSADGPDRRVEGVGAFGPSGPSLQDDQPCTQARTDFDVVLQRNRGSAPFSGSGDLAPPRNMTVRVVAGTSALGGTRGPGPVVGDLEYELADVSFTRR